ncbi:MAG: FAD-dependent oxidoreductase [Candidatus Hodarchaeota archaeon]
MIKNSTVGYRPKIYSKDNLDCPVIADVDVLVIGGSQSGVAAAVSAARAFKSLNHDAKILLVEQNNYLGGQSVTNMVTQWEIHAFRQNVGKWQIKGIGIEMVERIVALGGSDKLWEDLVSLNRQEDVEWPFLGPDRRIIGEESLNVEAIKLGLQEMCLDEGVELLLDTRAVAAIGSAEKKKPSGKLGELPGCELPVDIIAQAEGAIVEHYSGRGAILAKCVIDASANGIMPWWLGGLDGCTVNPATKRGLTQSYIWIGGADMEKLVNYFLSLPEGDFEVYPNDPDQLRKHAETGRLIYFKSKKIGAPVEVFDEAEENEDLDILFKSDFIVGGFYLKWVGNYPGHGVFALDGPYYREDSLDGQIWTSEHVRNIFGSWGMYRVVRHIPGFENAYIARTCERMGLRTTRIPKGIYKITGDDLKDHAEHLDAIGVGDWHDRTEIGDTGKWGYQIPLRALVSNTIDGLLFCARSVSFGPGAMNAHRGIGTTIVCGQGAGVGAAVAVATEVQPRDVDVKKVQDILKEQDVIFKIPEAV